jgi:hypothetical protein
MGSGADNFAEVQMDERTTETVTATAVRLAIISRILKFIKTSRASYRETLMRVDRTAMATTRFKSISIKLSFTYSMAASLFRCLRLSLYSPEIKRILRAKKG